MSYIVQPDPTPGRCHNYRRAPGFLMNHVRCLDYEGTEHVCRFPEVVAISAETYLSRQVAYTQPAPEPWIRPETT